MRTALGLGTKHNAKAQLLAKREYAEAHRNDAQSATTMSTRHAPITTKLRLYPRIRVCEVELLCH
jgi:hypothetical protein